MLLVDDQRFIAMAVRRVLEAEPDIELHVCDDPSRALAVAADIRPSLILQDLVMPGVDGISLIESFRRHGPTSSTPVIAISGSEDPSTRARALAAGANAFVLKLPPGDRLIACIRSHAAGERASAQQASDPLEGGTTLDPDVLGRLHPELAGARTFVTGLVDGFLEEASAHVRLFNDAAQRTNIDTVKRAAHSLKGSALTMGAKRLASLCSELEGTLEAGPGGDRAALVIGVIDQELVRVRDALRTLYPLSGRSATTR